MDCSMPGFPVLHYPLEFAQTQVHWVSDAIQPSHPLSLPPPPALNLSQHQGLFQWVSSSHQVVQSIGASASASVLPMNIQGWFPLGRTGLISLLSRRQGLFTSGKGAWDCVPTCPYLGPCIQLWFDFNFTAVVRLEPVSLRGRWYWAMDLGVKQTWVWTPFYHCTFLGWMVWAPSFSRYLLSVISSTFVSTWLCWVQMTYIKYLVSGSHQELIIILGGTCCWGTCCMHCTCS